MRSDSDIKQDLLDQIRAGPYADQYDIQVDVKKADLKDERQKP